MISNYPYRESESLLERALRSIPLGTQTFSKSKTQLPVGAAPLYAQRAKGSRMWDVDGNEYIDFVNGLLAITLGYSDPDVDAGVIDQLKRGILFSLPHPIEIEVAERLCDMIPCAEMVRFGKNGSDATAGAIRLARAFTGRDRIAVCGYHGWQDWYIGTTTRNAGVPEAVKDLSHKFAFNDAETLAALFRQWPSEFAAVILEPMNVTEPAPGFLEAIKEIAHRHGALLIFDETITGFRFHQGGAQALFGVTPDLATFGKGMANGYPLSAVVGRADVMRLMEEVFFSFTMGGEALSLAAAKATLDKIKREPVIEHLRSQGEKIKAGCAERIARYDIGDFVSVSGHPSWTFLNLKDATPYSVWQIRTLFYQELFARGIFCLGTHNVSYAHSDQDVAKLLSVYDEVFPILRDAVRNRSLEAELRCAPLEPLFRVR